MGVRRLRELADKGSGLRSEGLALQALHRQSAQLRAGLAQGYLKLRALTASAPRTIAA